MVIFLARLHICVFFVCLCTFVCARDFPLCLRCDFLPASLSFLVITFPFSSLPLPLLRSPSFLPFLSSPLSSVPFLLFSSLLFSLFLSISCSSPLLFPPFSFLLLYPPLSSFLLPHLMSRRCRTRERRSKSLRKREEARQKENQEAREREEAERQELKEGTSRGGQRSGLGWMRSQRSSGNARPRPRPGSESAPAGPGRRLPNRARRRLRRPRRRPLGLWRRRPSQRGPLGRRRYLLPISPTRSPGYACLWFNL
mmetsp:Transcript_25377/g.51711  ORF Transcript_25377/g.51711 Transcript_25377/m.51711 type:complete len:254 (-) Transcript_25377:73-834(-)